MGATLRCGARASLCGGFSCFRAQVLGCTAYSSCCMGSVVVAHGLSCSKACGIFPDQGLNLCPLHWQVASHPLYHQGSPTISLLCSPFSMPQSFYSFPNREFSSLCYLVTFSTIRGGDRGGHRERCLLELLIKLNFANQKATSPRGKLYHCL